MIFFKFFKKKKTNNKLPKISGGDGLTLDSAVIIDATNSILGVVAEYSYIQSLYGKRDKDWSLIFRELEDYNSKIYEVFTIELSDGNSKKIYFDITSFFGKF